MAQEKYVMVRIGTLEKAVPEQDLQKVLENQDRLIEALVQKGASREEAEKYFKATVVQ